MRAQAMRLLAWSPWLLAAAIAANALSFVAAVANPLVQSDSWYVVDAVLRKFAEGRFQLGDLFVKRSVLDHSQPVAKALMLAHYRLLDLDFSFDGMVAVLAACAGLGLLWRFVRDGARDGSGSGNGGATHAARAMAFAGICAAYLSMAAPVAFTWPLLSLNYVGYLFMLLAAAAAWRALQEPGRAELLRLALAALLMDIVGDDAALVASLALALATLLHGATSRAWRAPLRVVAVLLACVLLYRAGYDLLAPAMLDPGKAIPTRTLLQGLVAQLRDLQAVEWIRAPLVMSVLGLRRPAAMDPANVALLEDAIVLALVAGHAWFWWQAWRGRGRPGPMFVATALMLLFYGLLAAILFGRVGLFGADYLRQPRYCLVYQWNLVALLLMGAAHFDAGVVARVGVRRADAPTLVLAGVLVALQLPFSVASWARIGQSHAYRERMAAQIGQLAERPERLPARCLPQVAPCRLPLEQRRRVVSFLRQHRLNLFSPAFQARHDLHPWPARKPSNETGPR
jgi:hypothetical protein